MSHKLIVHPSPALVVRPDTPIIECVHEMTKREVGSVLISEASHPGHLLGIFTERDLLKWVDQLRSGDHWEKPVASLMTRSVRTIGIDQLDDAPDIMIEHGFRHLPVVYTDPASRESSISIVSMRDLMKALRRGAPPRATGDERPQRRETRIGLVTQSQATRYVLRRICARNGNSELELIELDELLRDVPARVKGLDHLVLDLDNVDARSWARALKALNSLSSPDVLIVFDPEFHTEAELEVLTKISHAGNIVAHMKPLNVFGVIEQLR